MVKFIALFMVIIFHWNIECNAQSGNSLNVPFDFVRGEKVIFEDNFHNDNINTFPAHWQVDPCTEQQYYYAKKSWKIEKEDGTVALRSGTTFMHISPVIKPTLYPRDSFNIEFDCTFEDPAACAELFFTTSQPTQPCSEVSFHISSWGKMNIYYPDGKIRFTSDYPWEFEYRSWHHFALSYCNKEIKCYLDGHTVLKIPDCGFSPITISLGCIAPVKFGDFIITRINHNSFNDLLKGKKFVTHAIHFDNDKSDIRPESMGFITQMIAFLQVNPAIKLEIDGHTDNNGNAGHNMDLSVARAEEVKKQLIEGGIDEQRLVAKGFGATKPVRPNTTAENKAENRRVEFIRL